MHAQVAWALDGGKVARLIVGVHARQKVFEHGLRARGARRNAQRAKIGGLKPDVGQGGHGHVKARRACGQTLAVAVAVVARRARVAHARQPSAQVGRKHAIGLAGLGEHLAPLKNHVVFDADPGHAMGCQRALHLGVSRQRGGLVVVGGKHGLGLQACGQAGNFVRRYRVAHDQASPGISRQGAQISVKLHQTGLDKFDPPVGARQGVQDVAVKHKNAMHLGAGLQRQGERGIVAGAQIAPKPDESGGVSVFHACR